MSNYDVTTDPSFRRDVIHKLIGVCYQLQTRKQDRPTHNLSSGESAMKTPHSNLEFRIALPSNVGQTRSHHCNDNGLYGFIDKVGLNLWELSEIPDDLSP